MSFYDSKQIKKRPEYERNFGGNSLLLHIELKKREK